MMFYFSNIRLTFFLNFELQFFDVRKYVYSLYYYLKIKAFEI